MVISWSFKIFFRLQREIDYSITNAKIYWIRSRTKQEELLRKNLFYFLYFDAFKKVLMLISVRAKEYMGLPWPILANGTFHSAEHYTITPAATPRLLRDNAQKPTKYTLRTPRWSQRSTPMENNIWTPSISKTKMHVISLCDSEHQIMTRKWITLLPLIFGPL